ncbi:MAG: hypothetical protein WD226_08780 [Planctomycetota bacterium]
MTSNLIVRDATHAINGDSSREGDRALHLKSRIAAVADLEREFLEECVQVLVASDGGDETDADILEALFVLGLGRPEVLAEMGLDQVSIGRRLAARMEREELPEASLAVLEFLLEHDPEHRGVQRDHAALMRRLGMVQSLVDRHLAAAGQLMSNGRNAEAIEVLREVLLLDRTRKDVARTIRDLRFADIEKHDERKNRVRKLLLVAAGSVLLVLLGLRERRLFDEYRALAGDDAGTVESVGARLNGVERFVDRHPVWLGSFGALEERGRLRIELDRLIREADRERLLRDQSLQHALEEAAWAMERGRDRARSGDFVSAIAELQRALELGGDDWSESEQIERNIRVLQQALDERR